MFLLLFFFFQHAQKKNIQLLETGYYRIQAHGARGGDANIPNGAINYRGGSGAVASAVYWLPKGTNLSVVVGQPGTRHAGKK